MQPTVDSQSARDELFRRIGRNVVNCQYLEATLRGMIPTLSNKWTLTELQAGQDNVARKHQKSTLGVLANAYRENMFGKDLAHEAVPDEVLAEPTLTVSFRVGVTPEKAAAWTRALVELVAERNRLIHTDLVNVDLESREECEEHSARLDEQYTRIQRWIEHLNSLRTNSRKMAENLQSFFESDEFLALLRGESSEAKPH